MMPTDTRVTEGRLAGPELQLVWKSVVDSYDYDALQEDLRFKLDRRLTDICATGKFPRVVFCVLDAAEREGWMPDLLAMLKDSTYPAAREIATRLLERHGPPAPSPPAAGTGLCPDPELASDPGATPPNGLAAGDPYLSHLVGQQIFIDRTMLRAHLRDLLSDSPSRVLIITGDRPCGKSYTWFYVSQRELLGGTVPVLVDLSEWTEPSLPVDVMSSIALQLRLPEPVIDRHAQGAAQALRLRDWLVGQLQPQEADGRWLLVFDSLDHVAQRDDTLQLIEFLARAAITQRVAGLRIVLLGYVNRLLVEPLETVLTERVEDIGEPELRDFYQSLAHRAGLSISEQAIELAVHGVLGRLPQDRKQKLCLLPKIVREVGNATFGMRLLP